MAADADMERELTALRDLMGGAVELDALRAAHDALALTRSRARHERTTLSGLEAVADERRAGPGAGQPAARGPHPAAPARPRAPPRGRAPRRGHHDGRARHAPHRARAGGRLSAATMAARVQAPPRTPPVPDLPADPARRARPTGSIRPSSPRSSKAESGFDPHAAVAGRRPRPAAADAGAAPGRMGVSRPLRRGRQPRRRRALPGRQPARLRRRPAPALAALPPGPRRGRAARRCARLLGYAGLPAEGNGVLRRVSGRRHVRPAHGATEWPRTITDGEGRC